MSSQIFVSPFTGIRLPPFSSRLVHATETENRGTCTTSPLPIFDRVKQTATGSHLYRDNRCNFGDVRRGETTTCNVFRLQTRRWLIAWRGFFARPRFITETRPTAPRSTQAQLVAPLAEFALWLEGAIFFASCTPFFLRLMDWGYRIKIKRKRTV